MKDPAYSVSRARSAAQSPLRVLFIVDELHWIFGKFARLIARFNPWIEATVISTEVFRAFLAREPSIHRRFDLVHVLDPHSAADLQTRFQMRLPCVTTHFHVSNWDAIAHNLSGDAIQTGCEYWSADIVARGAAAEQVFAVPYGVDAQSMFVPPTATERTRSRESLGISDQDVVIGFFAKRSSNDRFLDRKGTDTFLSASLQLSLEVPESIYLIVGPGWGKLVRAMRNQGVRCIWRPWISAEQSFAELYRAMDLYWVTSRMEGGPAPLVEAMATGIACISTPVGIAAEVLSDDVNGFLVDVGDAQRFARTSAALARDPGRRREIGARARDTVITKLDATVTWPRVRLLYEAAFAAFSRRTGRPLRLLPAVIVTDSVPPGSADGHTADVIEVPLAGFPIAWHREIRLRENLKWAEYLVLVERQVKEGLVLLARSWVRSLGSALPLRTLVRMFTPLAWRNAIYRVRVKWRSTRRTPD